MYPEITTHQTPTAAKRRRGYSKKSTANYDSFVAEIKCFFPEPFHSQTVVGNHLTAKHAISSSALYVLTKHGYLSRLNNKQLSATAKLHRLTGAKLRELMRAYNDETKQKQAAKAEAAAVSLDDLADSIAAADTIMDSVIQLSDPKPAQIDYKNKQQVLDFILSIDAEKISGPGQQDITLPPVEKGTLQQQSQQQYVVAIKLSSGDFRLSEIQDSLENARKLVEDKLLHGHPMAVIFILQEVCRPEMSISTSYTL